MIEIRAGEVWINGYDQIINVRPQRGAGSKYTAYLFECWEVGTDTYLFSCTKNGKFNKNRNSTSDLTQKLTREETPEYFL